MGLPVLYRLSSGRITCKVGGLVSSVNGSSCAFVQLFKSTIALIKEKKANSRLIFMITFFEFNYLRKLESRGLKSLRGFSEIEKLRVFP